MKLHPTDEDLSVGTPAADRMGHPHSCQKQAPFDFVWPKAGPNFAQDDTVVGISAADFGLKT